MNSLALFAFHSTADGTKKDAVSTFNDWSRLTGARFDRADEVAAALEHVRKLLNLDRKDLGAALKADGFVREPEE